MLNLLNKRTGPQCVSVSLPELLQLAALGKQLSLSALRRKSMQTGQRLSRLLGKGMEFAESRRYQAGDDIRCIDWRITARTGKAHTKLFTEEKERQVLLWVDMRAPMFFATQGVFKSVQAALLAGCVAWNAVQSGNRLGGLIFDDTHHHEFRPALGKKTLLPFFQQLSENTNTSNHKNKQSLIHIDEAITSIARVATPGSLVFIISDFRHLSNEARDLLSQVAKHSDLCLCFVYDAFEAAFPKNNYYPLTDGKQELRLNAYDQRGLEKYHQQFKERKEKLQALGSCHHIHFMECSTEDDSFSLLKEHFR